MLFCYDSRDLYVCYVAIQKAQLLAAQAEANAAANADAGLNAGAGAGGMGDGSANMTSRIALSAKDAFRKRNDLLTALEVTNYLVSASPSCNEMYADFRQSQCETLHSHSSVSFSRELC